MYGKRTCYFHVIHEDFHVCFRLFLGPDPKKCINHIMICVTDNVSCVKLLSVGLNASIRVMIRYSNDFGIEVNCEELLKLPSNSLH